MNSARQMHLQTHMLALLVMPQLCIDMGAAFVSLQDAEALWEQLQNTSISAGLRVQGA